MIVSKYELLTPLELRDPGVGKNPDYFPKLGRRGRWSFNFESEVYLDDF